MQCPLDPVLIGLFCSFFMVYTERKYDALKNNFAIHTVFYRFFRSFFTPIRLEREVCLGSDEIISAIQP